MIYSNAARRFGFVAVATFVLFHAPDSLADAADTAPPSATLTASSSIADPGDVAIVVLATSNVPKGSMVTLHSPLGGELWLASPGCDSKDHVHATPLSANGSLILCLTSNESRTIRAVVSLTLSPTQTLAVHSDAVAFSDERWWKPDSIISILTTLLSAGVGLLAGLYTQRSERRASAKEEARKLDHDQQSFLVKQLLPDLGDHVRTISRNLHRTADRRAELELLRMPNLVNLADSERLRNLASYFRKLGKEQVMARLDAYRIAGDTYNTLVRSRMREGALDDLSAEGQVLLGTLKGFGFEEGNAG